MSETPLNASSSTPPQSAGDADSSARPQESSNVDAHASASSSDVSPSASGGAGLPAANGGMLGWENEYLGLRARQSEVWTAQRAALRRTATLSDMVGQAKRRRAMQPQMLEILQQLQELEHQRSVGVYEVLLTAILKDALPGERVAKLSPRMLSGQPALDIDIIKDGNLESILDGSGGAVTNIICAGLRLIALTRSQNRRFIVMDEPDCWMKPSRVPKFASILGQIATQIQTQTVLISHHDPHFFANVAHLVNLERLPSGRIVANPVAQPGGHSHAPALWSDDTTPGIRWVRFINFMSHEDTIIQLSPHITCLTGENDLGKSACVAALRALFYGDSSDAYIKRGSDMFLVEAGLENGQVVSLRHFRKKSPKRMFEWVRPGMETQRSATKHGVPDWMRSVSGIGLLDGLDVQLRNQKEPVFLLNESAQKRASILAIGQEAGHLQAMIAKNRQNAQNDLSLERDGEKELFALSRELDAIGDIRAWPKQSDTMRDEGFALTTQLQALSTQKTLFAKAAYSRIQARVAQETRDILNRPLANVPVMEPSSVWRDKARWGRQAWTLAHTPCTFTALAAPSLEPTRAWHQLMKFARVNQRLAEIAVPGKLEDVPVLERSWDAQKLKIWRQLRALSVPTHLSSAVVVPTLEATKKARSLLEPARVSRALGATIELQELPAVPVLEDQSLARLRVKQARYAHRLATIGKAWSSTLDVPHLESVSKWRGIVAQWKATPVHQNLGALPASPQLEEVHKGRETLARARAALRAQQTAQAMRIEAQQKEINLREKWERSRPVCETCGQDVQWNAPLFHPHASAQSAPFPPSQNALPSSSETPHEH